MVHATGLESAQCAVYDKTPGSQQKKINIVVHPNYTVEKVFRDISTQYRYESYDLILQPVNEKDDMIYLNDIKSKTLYQVPGFVAQTKNFLILLPSGEWKKSSKKRYEISLGRVTQKQKQLQSKQQTENCSQELPKLKPESKPQKQVEEKTPQQSEKKLELKPEQKLELKPEQKPDQKLELKSEQKPKQRLAQKPKQKAESKIDKKSEKKLDQKADSKPEQKPESKSEQTIEEKLEQTVEQTSELKPEQKLDQKPKKLIKKQPKQPSKQVETQKPLQQPVQEQLKQPDVLEDNEQNQQIQNALDIRGQQDVKNELPIKEEDDVQQEDPQLQQDSSKYHYMLGLTMAADSLNLSPVTPDPLYDDDLALGASASPTEPDPLSTTTSMMLPRIPSPSARPPIGPMTEECYEQSSLSAEICNKLKSFSRQTSSAGYVGLVNQAMTCYLNSLLQALFMTPEFRNALYRWEFDNDNEAKSIPYQLQKLFLNLQTSKKSAVETTDLTRSFGWDSTEAWQQHDIQELCRVMFDALEHKFKNTKQANLISNLYEGKMIDYVKCLECNTEKTRADTFLDIPLPVRPFGSTVAYGSIEEALRAFVQPETLNGNNQYFCEKCDKKCDAHKGLKFKNFPYILTLHLKRFDFDYQTMHRIKLNDKVTFPQTLNLNTFINATDAQTFANYQSVHMNGFATAVNTDDCSTTDSGSAMEEDNCSGIATTGNSSQHENDMQEDDEGIDMSTSTDNRTTTSVSSASKADSGPYLYELFAIMIHSGSASGGHYYAYIKEFENGEWFCFNDQNVTPITQEDIQKSFGGSSTKAYYSSVYSSSTNAYMLMYRQIDPKRNERATKTEEFPEYINALLPKISCEDESRRSRHVHSDMALSIVKPRVYFYNPKFKKLKVIRVYNSSPYIDIKSTLETAYHLLNVEQFAPLSRCRLVAYIDEIIGSFENEDPSRFPPCDYLLECRGENEEFEVYDLLGFTMQTYKVNLQTMEVDGPHLVYTSSYEDLNILKKSVAIRLGLKRSEVLLATLAGHKVFVATDSNATEEAEDNFKNTVKRMFRNLTYFFMTVPNTDPDSLEIMSIPPYEPQTNANGADVVDAVLMNGDASSEYYRRESPLPPTTTESNSEDSSLSDGDRTLVDTNTGMSSASHSPQMSSPEESESQDMFHKLNSILVDAPRVSTTDESGQNLYFFATKIDADPPPSAAAAALNGNSIDDSEDCNRKPPVMYKVFVDSHMKMAQLKRHLEALIRVPGNYFKVSRKYDTSDPIYPSHTLLFLSEGEMLIVELGKILQTDEYKGKVYFMKLSELDNNSGKLPCVCEWIFKQGLYVRDAKKQLVAQLHRIDPKYKTLSVENCRLWIKGGRNPVYFLGDDEQLGNDGRVAISSEFLIQECEDGISPHTGEDNLTIFVRRWHPDTLELDKFQEITLEKHTEIKQMIASVSDIPEENIAYSKINSSFPCTNISLLNINSSMNWFTNPATVDKFPLTTILSGNVVFYKDNTDQPKELAMEERRELNVKEKTRLDRLGCASTTLYSPRRERALKIYLDLSPKGGAPSGTSTTSTSSEGILHSKRADQ